ncbi:glycosyl transferase family 1 [Vibrio splendidus]|uniref:Glycosyltransferase family 4 protein n=1 Tax=Vibrio splendidus TaxID=29497 RepID=A0AB35N3M2_VIBSP|nr:glycosyltransferase family 4 protein [Vibrio splendidus]MDP2502850.1 glycosyltransferase family 4 protein [Vibrio splendidus]PMG54850.1 glycosyl transferase family 1 [Vibrio splendidus]PMM74649.1 glycosyl transferase family 1 [Vibrio splendidus]
MKKILVITPRFPYPVIGGDRLRIFELCKFLSAYYDLTLVSLCETDDELQFPLPNDGVFKSVKRVLLPKWKSYANCMRALLSQKPLQVAYYESSEFGNLVNEIHGDYDLVIPHLIRVADYVKDLDIPKIIEMTDAISMNYERLAKVNGNTGIKGLIYKLEKSRLHEYEKNIITKFDYSIFVSQFDRDFLIEKSESFYTKMLICSNGVDRDRLPYNYQTGSLKLIFIGNMTSTQNYDAAYFFAKNVLSELRRIAPYEFCIIGRINEAQMKTLMEIDGVTVTGGVSSIPDTAAGALAGICSVRIAAGVQNKILEYMALGIPTISSSTGLEGLNAKHDESILVADTVDEYVQMVEKLRKNQRFAENISLNALNYIQNNHSWYHMLTPLHMAIDTLLDEANC